METYEIHNRELLMRGLEKCAGPDCCKETCPYYGRARGGKSCRATLLEDAVAALTKDKDDLDALEAAANTYRDERDKLREGWHDLCDERDKLTAEVDDLEAANNAYRTERDELAAELAALKLGKKEEKTDRPSVRDKELMEEVGKLIAQAKYQEGKADALEWFLREWFRERGFQE